MAESILTSSGVRPADWVKIGLLISMVALAACARSSPAPVVYGDKPAKASTPKTASMPTPKGPPGKPISGNSYRIQDGDTLYSVSRRTNVPLRDLIEVNGLGPPYRLLRGEIIQVPRLRYHQVAADETLYSIARQNGVSLNRLVQANALEAPYTIRVGQRLSLPGRQVAIAPEPKAKPKTVKRRPLTSPQDRLVYRQIRTADGKWIPVPLHKPKRPKKPPIMVARKGSLAAPPPRAGPSFAWPAAGRIISSFGAKAGGRRNDGINILLRKGTPVRAADNGVVAYAGNELRGFGNLILVRHRGGWVTAYAHAATIGVKVGQVVQRGQVLARAGDTGGVARPQLHFEIRRGRTAIDPLIHLSSG